MPCERTTPSWHVGVLFCSGARQAVLWWSLGKCAAAKSLVSRAFAMWKPPYFSQCECTLCGGLHIWVHAQLCACASCECMAYYITVVARWPQFEVGQSLWPHLNGATGSCLVRQRKIRSDHRSDLPESCRGCACRSSGFFVRWRPQGPSRNRGEVPPTRHTATKGRCVR